MRARTLLAVVVVVGISATNVAVALDDGLVCRVPPSSSPVIDFHPEVAGLIAENVDTLTIVDSYFAGLADDEVVVKKGGPVRYSINDSISAAVSYNHTFLFATGTNKEVRTHRFGAFSTDRERDIVGLGMDWSLGDSVVGLGYQLESTRPAPSRSVPASILPRSQDVEHAFTLGVTRRWGGAD